MINVWMDDMKTPTIEKTMFGEVLTVPDPYWVVARTIADAKALLVAGLVNDMALDHDLGDGETGHDFLKWMERSAVWPKGKITLITGNTIGRMNMLAVLTRNNKT